MASTLLQLVDRAANELSLAAPATVISNSNQQVVHLLALANAVGYELLEDAYNWQRLTKEYRTTMVKYSYTGTTTSGSTTITGMSSVVGLSARFMVTGTGIEQDTYVVTATSDVVISRAASASGTVTLTFSQTQYSMPSDFSRIVDNTEWDKSKHWVMLGPSTPQQWQWLKSGYISTGPRMRFRILGGYFQIWPASGVEDYIGFEYLSNNWVLAAADTVTPTKTSFTVDTDTCVFSDTLMVVGIKSKYMISKGWADPYGVQFERDKANEIAADAGSPKLSMAPRLSEVLISQTNIPESDFGS